MSSILKWIFKKIWSSSPKCVCGYSMRPIGDIDENPFWECIWKKQCGYRAFETWNGILHWYR